MAPISIWYFIITIWNIIIFITNIYFKFDLKDFFLFIIFTEIWIVFLGIIYFGYMTLDSCKSNESNENSEYLNSRTSFMVNTYFKYYFCIVIALAINRLLYNILYNKFYSYKTDLIFKYAPYYSISILPIICLIEVFLKKRERSSNPKRDIICLLIVITIMEFFFIYEIYSLIKLIISICVFLTCTYFSYILYDYLIFKTNGGEDYILLTNKKSYF
jgi:hypothetical protein